MEATSIASPVAASQAENVSMRMGTKVEDGVWFSIDQDDRAMYMDSIMLSRHRRAETRWVRWKVNPRQLRVKAE